MPATHDFAQPTLRSLLRVAPLLEPEDSLRRFAQLTRYDSLTQLPVLRHGILLGMITQEEVLTVLALGSLEEREQALNRPVSEFMQPASVVLKPGMSVQEMGWLFAEHRVSTLPLVDDENYCLGVLCATDLLLPELPTPQPARIGGMATPFGVYLTDGAVQAGVGTGALIASGTTLGLMLTLSYSLVQGGLWLVQKVSPFPNSPLYNLSYAPPSNQIVPGLISTGLSLLVTLLFLLLMRVTRLAGYHSAEHQTVHALERGEKLVPDIVRRMPRAHPRCGTNIMAAGLVFFNLAQIFEYLPGLGSLAYVLAAIATFFTWRSVGTFLQERFTTKPPSDRELASGIAAGEALVERFLYSPPERPSFWKRLWYSGMLQVLIGLLPFLVIPWLADMWRH